jgi:hypothetical protein
MVAKNAKSSRQQKWGQEISIVKKRNRKCQLVGAQSIWPDFPNNSV